MNEKFDWVNFVVDNHTDAVLARLKETGKLKKVTMPGPQEGRVWLEAEPAQSEWFCPSCDGGLPTTCKCLESAQSDGAEGATE